MKITATVIDEHTGEQKLVSLEAGSREEAIRRLRADGLIPLKVAADDASQSQKRQRRFPARQAAVYFRQLRALLKTGRVTPQEALELLAEMVPPPFRERAHGIANQVAQGSTLAAAIRQSGLFPPLAPALIAIGEEAGDLLNIIDALAIYFEKQAYYMGKVKSALTYPAAVLVLAILMTYAMLSFMVPQFVGFLKDMNAEIPAMTRAVIALSNLTRSPLGLLVIALLAAGAFYAPRYLKDKPELAERVERYLLRLPIAGPLLKYLNLARIARALELQQRAGLPLNRALQQTAQAVDMHSYRRALEEAVLLVESGQPLYRAFEQHPHLFPSLVVALIRTGVGTGELDEMLGQISSIYEEETDALLGSLSSLVEPLLLVVVGIIIGGIMLSILLPYFAIAQQVSRGL